MRSVVLFIITFIICSIFGCTETKVEIEEAGGNDTTWYYTTDSIPQFIKDSLTYDYGFSMADPGEEWNVGCIRLYQPVIDSLTGDTNYVDKYGPSMRLDHLMKTSDEWIISYEQSGEAVETKVRKFPLNPNNKNK